LNFDTQNVIFDQENFGQIVFSHDFGCWVRTLSSIESPSFELSDPFVLILVLLNLSVVNLDQVDDLIT
jgi:hypothetical protein